MIAIASVNVNTVAFVTYMAKRAVVYFREHSEYGLIVSSIITDVPELNRPEMSPNTHTHTNVCAMNSNPFISTRTSPIVEMQ